jgi:hypothetical protein
MRWILLIKIYFQENCIIYPFGIIIIIIIITLFSYLILIVTIKQGIVAKKQKYDIRFTWR